VTPSWEGIDVPNLEWRNKKRTFLIQRKVRVQNSILLWSSRCRGRREKRGDRVAVRPHDKPALESLPAGLTALVCGE
jgi:hypothetical protein